MLPEERISFPSQAQGFACRVAAQFNHRPALDAAMSISLHFGRHWRRASEAERYA
jgi:hypothetical protein